MPRNEHTLSLRARVREMERIEVERDAYRSALERIVAAPCEECRTRITSDGDVRILHCFGEPDDPHGIARDVLDRYPHVR